MPAIGHFTKSTVTRTYPRRRAERTSFLTRTGRKTGCLEGRNADAATAAAIKSVLTTASVETISTIRSSSKEAIDPVLLPQECGEDVTDRQKSPKKRLQRPFWAKSANVGRIFECFRTPSAPFEHRWEVSSHKDQLRSRVIAGGERDKTSSDLPYTDVHSRVM